MTPITTFIRAGLASLPLAELPWLYLSALLLTG